MSEEQAPAAPETTPEPPKGDSTFTQQQVNDLIAREKGKIQAKYEGFDDLKAKAARLDEIEAENATELEKANKAKTKAEQDAAEAKTKLLRYEVAQEKEVPAKLVPLLTATDKEGLEAQADLILENAKPDNPDFDGGARQAPPDPQTPEQQAQAVTLAALGLTPPT